MEAELGWNEAIKSVLERAKRPLSYTEIAEEIYKEGLRTERTATPANTVAARLGQSLRDDGDRSPFIRVSPGIWALRGTAPIAKEDLEPVEADELTKADEVTGLVNAFGMFWDRTKVHWKTDPNIFGRQQESNVPVDFCEQRGVYLLHDSQGVVYVGRTTDQNLGKRLYQHMSDRLEGRWTRFSWFGVFAAKEDGTLKTTLDFSNIDNAIVIATMEAVLIESLEPRQNRKRGDEFKAIEYIQVEDPQVAKELKLAMLRELETQLKI